MKIKDEFRTNPLSHLPGGCTVRVTFKNGTHRDYDKVKKPMAFINAIQKVGNDVAECRILEWDESDKNKTSK